MPDTQSDFLLLILFCILDAGNHFILSLCILKETMYLFFFLAVLGLCCCRASPLVVASRGYCLTQWTGFSLQQLLLLSVSSRMHRLNSCGAWLCCSAACGILLDQGSNLCLLHWQVESLPPSLQGSPYLHLWVKKSFSLPPPPARCQSIWWSHTQKVRVKSTLMALKYCNHWKWFSSVQSLSRVCLRPHVLQHARPPCPSPTPRIYPNSCPSSQWCHPAISSSVVPFSSHVQSFPASGSFLMSQFFTSGGPSIGSDYSL